MGLHAALPVKPTRMRGNGATALLQLAALPVLLFFPLAALPFALPFAPLPCVRPQLGASAC
eukprot:COSAG02_NODE_5476_length_4292_cov_23.188409_1_plen_61_part_00